jgi:hypothetical protein
MFRAVASLSLLCPGRTGVLEDVESGEWQACERGAEAVVDWFFLWTRAYEKTLSEDRVRLRAGLNSIG